MKCAPVMMITLNRIDFLKACIASLRKNPYAMDTDLYIGLDYPLRESHVEGYQKIKKFIDAGIDGFANVIVVEQKENVGPANNFVAIREKVYETYDRYIFTEDDNVFSPNYLEYMNKAMEKWEADDEVLAVSGYAYPIDASDIEGNVYRLNNYFSALGYGTWKTKMDQMYENLNTYLLDDFYKDSTKMKKLQRNAPNQFCNYIKGLVGFTPDLIADGNIREIDLSYGLYMHGYSKYMVFPTRSKVRNCGYDGSGVNCGELLVDKTKKISHRNFDFSTQEMDENNTFDELKISAVEEKILNQKTNDFFCIPQREVWKCWITYQLVRLFGVGKISKLIDICRK